MDVDVEYSIYCNIYMLQNILYWSEENMIQSEIKITILEALNQNNKLPKIDGLGEFSYKKLLGEMREEGLIDFINLLKPFDEWKVNIKSRGITYLEMFKLNHK